MSVQMWQTHVPCAFCKTEFIRHYARQNQRFCSRSCSDKNRRGDRSAARWASAVDPESRRCPTCTKPMTGRKARNVSFCSKECKTVAGRAEVVSTDAKSFSLMAVSPCESCAAWAACEGSETGGQCLDGRYRAGKPWTGSCAFKRTTK